MLGKSKAILLLEWGSESGILRWTPHCLALEAVQSTNGYLLIKLSFGTAMLAKWHPCTNLVYIRGILFLNKLDWNPLAKQIILYNANGHPLICIFCKVGVNAFGFFQLCHLKSNCCGGGERRISGEGALTPSNLRKPFSQWLFLGTKYYPCHLKDLK